METEYFYLTFEQKIIAKWTRTKYLWLYSNHQCYKTLKLINININIEVLTFNPTLTIVLT